MVEAGVVSEPTAMRPDGGEAEGTRAPTEEEKGKKGGGKCRVLVFFLKILLVFAAMWLIFYFCQDQLKDMLKSFKNLKPKWLGPILYVLLIAVWSVVMLPQTIVEVGAGAIWGLYLGGLVALVGKTAGSCLCFLLSRRFGAALVSRRLGEGSEASALLGALSHLVKRRPHFFTALVCAAFVPASVKSYGLGTLEAVPFKVYLLYCLLCGVPFCLVNAFVGSEASGVGGALDEGSGGGAGGESGGVARAAAGVALGCTAVLVLAFGYFTKKTLDKHIAEAKERIRAQEDGEEGRSQPTGNWAATAASGEVASPLMSGMGSYGTLETSTQLAEGIRVIV